MPVALTTLFCQPSDVWDILSVEGVDLREDDHNLATGQNISVTADAAQGATSLTVDALAVPLLKGSALTFDGGGLTAPITISLSAVGNVGDTTLSVAALSGAVPVGAVAYDSGVNTATGARLLTGCRKGTSTVKRYCNGRYDDSQLVLSGSVCDWAAMFAAEFLCARRAQSVPKGIDRFIERYMEELRMVQAGQLQIEDIGTRGADWPTITNVTVDPGYDLMRARVEPAISEGTPTVYGQFVDWNSVCILEW